MKNKETKKITKLETLSYILIIINLLLIFLVAYTYFNKQETPKEEKKISPAVLPFLLRKRRGLF